MQPLNIISLDILFAEVNWKGGHGKGLLNAYLPTKYWRGGEGLLNADLPTIGPSTITGH